MTLAEEIYDYSLQIDKILKDKNTLEELKKRVVDSIFVSYGAKSSRPVNIAKEALLPSSGSLTSPIYFDKRNATIDVASYINGCMTRYLDYNDTYLSKEALHPSDNIPPILAYAYSTGKSGMEVLKAIAAAYQIVGAFSDAVSIRDRGWDHVTYISISAAVGLAVLNNLCKKDFLNTINLALNNNISLRQTRAGELSMWKGCTAANASRNSVFATILASKGMTGPSPIFEGEMGFFRQVSGELNIDFEKNRILRTLIKNYPVEYHAMSAIEAALSLRKRINVERVRKVRVDTFTVAYKIIIKDPEKSRPSTKETADHSMQYLIAYTLIHGAPNEGSFSEKFLRDSDILHLIDVMEFNISKEYDSLYPDYLPVKISIETSDHTYEEEVKVPKGHFRNPYDWSDLANKGKRIMDVKERAQKIVELGMKLDTISTKYFLDEVNKICSD